MENRSLLVVSTQPYEHPTTQSVTNRIELDAVLRRSGATLSIALVFTDFDLSIELAEKIHKALPIVLVDLRSQYATRPLQAGFGFLLKELTFFDRLYVPDEAVWQRHRSEFDLPNECRAVWSGDLPMGAELIAGVHERLMDLSDAPQVDADADGPGEAAAAGLDSLRLAKLSHLVEQAMVDRFLAPHLVRRDASNPYRLLDLTPQPSRWEFGFRERVSYVPGARQSEASVEPCDCVLAVDFIRPGTQGWRNRLERAVAHCPDWARMLLLESYSQLDGEAFGGIYDFEAHLWWSSDGALALEDVEILRYPHLPLENMRAMLKLRKIA